MENKPKILLVEVPELKVTYEINGKEEICSAVRTHYPKQSQLILAGILRKLGKIEIIDMKMLDSGREEFFKQFSYGNGKIRCYRKGASFERIADKIMECRIIGLTSNFTKSSGIVIDFIKYAKNINPNAKVVVGGCDATPRYNYYLENGADVVVLGEGELIGPRIVKALVNDQSLEHISGIAYRTNNGIICNQRNPKGDNVNVDDIPLPAFDLVAPDLEKYIEAFDGPLPKNIKLPIGILETSRGCTQACPFCTTPFLRKRYRPMSTKRIGKWLDHYKKYGIETIILMEDNILSRLEFSNGKQKLTKLFNLLRKYDFAWEFGNGVEIGKLITNEGVDKELIERMFCHKIKDGKYVGCYRAFIPLECLQGEPQKIYKKLVPYEQELEIIKTIASTEIPMISFGVIIGRPDDNEQTLDLTERRCLEIKRIVKDRGIGVLFTPFLDILLPGTPDYKQYEHLIKYNIEQYPELYQFHTSAIQANFEPTKLALLKKKLMERLNGKKLTNFWSSTGKYRWK